jgi:hypothetical protein
MKRHNPTFLIAADGPEYFLIKTVFCAGLGMCEACCAALLFIRIQMYYIYMTVG